ncbi:hypothetical protein HUJ04_001173 [Dendroctonus ponderosae]
MRGNGKPDVELEEQFILRLPQRQADSIRTILRTKPQTLKKTLKIDLNIATGVGAVIVGRKRLSAYLIKLPTIVESYKTNIVGDRSTLFKTADITMIVQCTEEPLNQFTAESPHGYTLPLKNVRRRRFRKTLVNPEVAEEAEMVNRELYYLLSTDLQATSTRFEVQYEKCPPQTSCQFEKLLFGQVSSSDSEIDVED